MRRREFNALVGAAVVIPSMSLPRSAWAQQAARLWRVAVLTTQTSDTPPIKAFRQRLRDLGYVVGQNLVFDERNAASGSDRLSGHAIDLVASGVDVIFASGSEAALAAQRATTTIPIVVASSDPVGLGLVASLARPGANITGINMINAEIAGKQVDLIKKILPGMSKLAVMRNSNDPATVASLNVALSAAEALMVEIQSIEVMKVEAFDAAFRAASENRAEAIMLLSSPLFTWNARLCAELGVRYKLPTIYRSDELPRAGGLMSYGANQGAMYMRAAYLVDRILKGDKPADLPVEQPTKLELVLNMKTAKKLGLELPATLLAVADEVIE